MANEKLDALRSGYASLAKKLDLPKKALEIDDEKLLSLVNGGSSGANSTGCQLYYKGQPLPMDKKVSQLCSDYPELKDALGNYYGWVANMTLNALCSTLGQDTIQSLIDQYSK